MGKFKKGDKVYIIESMGQKTVCTVISSSGGFTTVKFKSYMGNGAIRLRDSRVFPYVEEEKPDDDKSSLPKATQYTDPHKYMDPKSKYGP